MQVVSTAVWLSRAGCDVNNRLFALSLHGFTEITTYVSNHIYCFMLNVIIHPYPSVNNGSEQFE